MLVNARSEVNSSINRKTVILFILFLVVVFITLWSINNKPVTSANLSTTTSTTRDAEGNEITSSSYTDSTGRIVIASDKGYATIRKTKNSDGKVILEEYLDENGGRVVLSSGYSMIAYSYIDGLNTTIWYLDTVGSLVVITSGYDTIHRTYNNQGLADTDTYWITTNPGACENSVPGDGVEVAVICSQGYAQLRRIYDDQKRIIMQEYRDLNGELVTNSSGYAYLIRTYHENGKVAQERYYNEENRPAVLSLGQSGFSRMYDEQGRIIETMYLGTDGSTINTNKGYSSVKIVYTENGKKTQYYDLDGKPVMVGKSNYGTMTTSDGKIMLDEDGNEMIRLDNILSSRPYLVLILGIVAVILILLIPEKMRIIFLIVYLGFILYMTMAYRETGDQRTALTLFNSYRRFLSSSGMRRQIINNFWLFVPLGAVLTRLLQSRYSNFKSVVFSVLCCVFFSLFIETVQYVARIGLAEVDDVVSNSLGGVIGAAMAVPMPLIHLPSHKSNVREESD